MRKLKLFGAAALLTLVASGVAVAHEGTKKADTTTATATFTAERTKVSERSCTGEDGTYRIAREEFRGTITSADARFAGNIVLRTKSVINETERTGRTVGHATIRNGEGKLLGKAALVAVTTELNVLNGVLTGHVRDAGDEHGGHLVANFTAAFSSPTKLTGTFGGGDAANTAVVQAHGGCPKAETDEAGAKKSTKARLVIKSGEVSALTDTSMTVKVGDASIVFSLTERLTRLVDELDLEVGSKVKVVYVVKGESTTLLKLRKA